MNSLLGGRYQLGQMIGTGGMADVYIAQDQRLSREVAIKILRSDLAKDPAFVMRTLPVPRATLRAEGLSESFIGYMGNWPGFAEAE